MKDRTDRWFWARGFAPVGLSLTLFQAVEHLDHVFTLRFLGVALVINGMMLAFGYFVAPWLFSLLQRFFSGSHED